MVDGEEIVGEIVGDYVGDEERLHDGDHMAHRVQREINKDNSLYVGETCYSRHANLLSSFSNLL
jgi:hypothetical protein